MTDPIHHIHKRKRIHQKHETYPHPNKVKRLLDFSIYAVGILLPFMVSLQAFKIWNEKNAESIALPTFVALTLGNILWVVYGLVHKEKPIVVTHTLFTLVNVAIVLGTILYG
ncbi:hypothetical protein H6758_00390 [Candidatus Nomurabacteria bacterium]|nr:hypothetical protein [Candidatus Nomurabacteria bacterium]